MSLSRKYYKLLADLIGSSQDLAEFTGNLAVKLQQDNPTFNRELFLSAIRRKASYSRPVEYLTEKVIQQ